MLIELQQIVFGNNGKYQKPAIAFPVAKKLIGMSYPSVYHHVMVHYYAEYQSVVQYLIKSYFENKINTC